MKRYIRSARSSKSYIAPQNRTSYPWANRNQKEEIRKGRRSGVDVSVYADPKFDGWQMREIRKGLESGVDVGIYADPKVYGWRMLEIRLGLEKYANDLLLNQVSAEEIALAYQKGFPSLAYFGAQNKYQRAKLNWQAVKDAVASRNPIDIPALEEEFNLGTLEGRAAYTLGINFDENEDGSVTFTNSQNLEIATISSTEFDNLVRNAIANSSTRQSFAKAFATQLKRTLDM